MIHYFELSSLYISHLAPPQGFIGTPEQQNDHRAIEHSSHREAVEAEDCAESDEGVIKVNFIEVVLEDGPTAEVEESKADPCRQVCQVVAVTCAIVFGQGEYHHDEIGGYQREEGDSADQERQHDVELTEPEDLEEGQAEEYVLDRDHYIIRHQIGDVRNKLVLVLPKK